jgi:F-type H+-transporting ATPase subunit b
VDLLSIAGGNLPDVIALAAEAGGGEEAPAFQINLFWIVMQAVSFLIFLAILYVAAFRRIGGVLEERRSTIEQGLKDAEQARIDRQKAAEEHAKALADARREANEIIARAQRLAEESREADLAATREELERLRQRAQADIEAEKDRAIADLRAEVADLALEAAGKVIGESMDSARQRRLVEEFLSEASTASDTRRS